MNEVMMSEAVKKYQTPLYLFDGDGIEERYQFMKNELPEAFEIFFSVKANPLYGICRVLHRNGCGIEVASAGELYLALKAGFDTDKILFTGPGKSMEELEFAVDKDIASINAESFQEIKLLDKIAKEKGKTVNVGIRIHPNLKVETKTPAISMMGKGTQFGIDIDEVPEVLQFIKGSNLNLCCFHVYTGSQVFDSNTTILYFREMIKIFKKLIEEHQLDIKIIDFGGGFGVSYDGKKDPYDFKNLALEVAKTCDEYEDFLKEKRIIFECGRFLMAENGVFLTRVEYRKKLHDSTFLITDGGMNQAAMATFRGKVIRGNFKMKILNACEEEEQVTVAGPLCTPDDVLGRNITLSKADRGDILCLENMGAYGSSYSPLNFLGHTTPCEVLLYKEKEYCLKQHGNISDIMLNQNEIDL